MSNIFDSLKNKNPQPEETDGIGSIDKWVCSNCLHENYENPMTPRKSRPFICKKCGAKKGEIHIYDIGGMSYNWEIDYCKALWRSKDGKYVIKKDKDKLTLSFDDQIVCEKAFYSEFAGKRIEGARQRPDYIRAEDGKGFGEISYFAFIGMNGSPSPVIGIIEKNGKTERIEFTLSSDNCSKNGWTCICGHSFNSGKYCLNCGLPQPIPQPTVVPLISCSGCGWQPKDSINPPKYCPECGTPFAGNKN